LNKSFKKFNPYAARRLNPRKIKSQSTSLNKTLEQVSAEASPISRGSKYLRKTGYLKKYGARNSRISTKNFKK
jgi:hypothetical protein